MSTTKHLDTAIAILGGGKTRKSRKNEIVLTDLGDQGVAVQVNGRQVHVAARHGEPVGLADDGAAHHLDPEMKLPDHLLQDL